MKGTSESETQQIIIRNLFDSNKDIYRTIEKVITYAASQESRLKAEVSEYVVTDSIEEQIRKLLDKMQLAIEAGGENEVGVWVSGFYGSGKSSFTKYLGLSFDSNVKVEGLPLVKHLQDRLHSAQVKALLATVTQRFPAAVVMLDLASEMLAGATMEDVSTVLYYKVLQWAGYSRNIKVAALERRLEKDKRHQEFLERVSTALPNVTWKELQNDPLVVDGLVPQIAYEMYPGLFPTPNSFSSSTEGFFQFEDQRVEEMISIVREKSGKQHILFVIDEVGQYVASRDNLILNLDGLAKNLKRLGDGKVWIIATAQQTLTEDDPRASLNSPQLFKLKDRFPIQVDLESSDIKEICYRRLLGKSTPGATALGLLFDKYGQALRHNTKLQDAKYYDADFSKETFTNLYPFLPAHFDILLHLLGALAKSTGGIGLRSAIKVIQDILVEGGDGRSPVADQKLGWLATTVTLYDALDKDIRRAFGSIHQAVHKTFIRFPESQLHHEIAKSVAVLQILGNLPVTVQNLASLMHPSVSNASLVDDVRKAVNDMLNDPLVPLGDKDGSLCFLSEKLRDIEQERGSIVLRSVDCKRVFNEALTEVFNPLPTTRLHGTLAVTSGLKVQATPIVTTLAGERETIQTVVELMPSTDYEAARNRLTDDSRQRTAQTTIFLLGRTHADIDNVVAEIHRSQRIAELHRNDPDQEVREYSASQLDRAVKLTEQQLKPLIRQSLTQGSFVFRGQATAVSTLDQDVLQAAKKYLANVADQVFDRYAEAPERVETALAEKFLKVGNLSSVTSTVDPLALVQMKKGGAPTVNTSHKAIVSIRDYIDKNGSVEGKRLLDHFGDAPFGWSPDTFRYVLAVMLIAGEIKLKVSGREVLVNGQQAIEALKTNKSFGSVGVSLRDERPSVEILARAAQRLTELIGETVIPLEQEISKAAVKQFPSFQHEYSPLGEKLIALQLPGTDALRSLTEDIKDVLYTDASDAPQRLGAEESLLYARLKWSAEVKRALDNGLEQVVRELQQHRQEVEDLPDTGIPGELRSELAEDLAFVKERLHSDDFYQHFADLSSALTRIKTGFQSASKKLSKGQKQRLQEAVQDLQRLPGWTELTNEEQSNVLARLDTSSTAVPNMDLSGLKQLLSREYDINICLSELKDFIKKQGEERLRNRLQQETETQEGGTNESNEGPRPKIKRSISIPNRIDSGSQLEFLIDQLEELRRLWTIADIEVDIVIQNKDEQ